ncbi:CZB domain-containing protein [Beggiatoa leptomitoformis]|uniref:Chemoreceptor zinc-binding domain-containing protein n=1 Tax=Beggiatoa leptomitoformis TaxID=288004 RepID=A0A2N9YD94_9GAMM|nr:hypothetical protein AL038_17255 [Beggiatoa leptomitoformis]AUI68473.1 hypothetical protein BLE401_06970 [Beggiatoa leptomitoformis]
MANKAFFMLRLNDHIQYLRKMDAALKSESDFLGSTHQDCKLGKWIYGEALDEIAALQDYAKAKAIYDSMLGPHEQFHAAGHKALECKKVGNEAGAQAAMTEMHILSNTLTTKLLELDKLS